MTFFVALRAVSIAALSVATIVFGGLVVIVPWLYGGVEQWVRAAAAWTLIVGVAAAVVRFLVLPARDSSPTEPLTLRGFVVLLPIGGLIAVAGLQLAGGLVPVDSDGAFYSPRTIFPAETRLALASMLAVAAAVWLGATTFSREPVFHSVLTICLVAAAAVAFGGIAMRLTGDDRTIVGAGALGDPFARFINRNNAAAFLQLGIACGLALLRSASRPSYLATEETFLGRGWRSVDRATLVVVAATLLALCLAGVVASRSRGGMIAAACTVSVAVPFFQVRNAAQRAALLIGPLLAAGALLFWLGLSSPAVERFESLTVDNVLTSGRIPHWKDASHAIEARPIFGAGLGTYGYAFQQFSRLDYTSWFKNADNQYVELLVETGTIGAFLLTLAFGISALGVFRGVGRAVERVLVTSLVAGQAAHAMFDFGILMPAVGLTCAALWAAGVVRLLSASSPATRRLGFGLRSIAVATGAATIAGLVWSQQEHQKAWPVERYSRAASGLDHPEKFEGGALDQAIDDLAAALRDRPDDAVGQLCLAELYVYRYRTIAARQLRQIDTTLSPVAVWDLTRLSSLHRTVNTVTRSGAAAGITMLRANPVVRDNLVPARQRYEQAAAGCPRLPGIWIPLASLTFLDDKPGGTGTAEVKTILRLFPANVELVRTAGRVAWQADDRDLAGRCWRQAFGINPADYWSFVAGLAEEVGPADAVRYSCPDDPVAILQIASNTPLTNQVSIGEPLGRRLEGIAATLPEGRLKDRCLVAADRLAGRLAEAEERLSLLIAGDAGDAALHGEMALVHWEAGRATDALDEAVMAEVLDRRYADLRQRLAAQLRTMPSMKDVTTGRRRR